MTRRKMNDGYYMPRLYDFLSCLRDNNYREWFKANKAEYDDLRAAWIEDIDRMIVLMGRWEPAIAMANSGKTASYRIYRDTRFSQDKTPFKTYFSASVSTRGRAPHYGGYYIEAGPGSFGGNADSGLFGGMWCPEPAVLKKIRKAIVDNIEEFEGIISAPALQREFPGWCGSSLKTVPKGYDRNHPQAHLLRLKDFGKFHPCRADFFFDPAWPEKSAELFSLLKPLIDFLNYSAEEED